MNQAGIFLRKFWSGFLWFRKRFFPFRLIILLAILTLLVAERVFWPHPSRHYFAAPFQELVYNACEAIRGASEPKVLHAQLVYNKAEACAELKRKLAPFRSQLPPGLLDNKPKDSDLSSLYAEAVRLRIEPYVSQDYKTFRRKLFADAQQKTDREFSPAWAEVKEDIFRFQGWSLREPFSNFYIILIYIFPFGYVIPLFFAVLAGYILYYKKNRWLLWGLPVCVFAYTLMFSSIKLFLWTGVTDLLWRLLDIYIPWLGFVAAAVLVGIRLREKGVPFGRFLICFLVLATAFLWLAGHVDYFWYSSFHYSWETILPYLIPGIGLLLLPLFFRRLRIPFLSDSDSVPKGSPGKDD